jgi:hypothetical protein
LPTSSCTDAIINCPKRNPLLSLKRRASAAAHFGRLARLLRSVTHLGWILYVVNVVDASAGKRRPYTF